MNERMMLMDADKEELVDEILRLRDENKKLVEIIEELRKQVEQIIAAKKTHPVKFEENQKSDKRSLPPHKWGRKEGHEGSTRPIPLCIDKEVIQSLERCPNCRHQLGQPVESAEHIQEDIVPARVEVTRFIHNRYWCPCCQKIITAPYGENEVPHGYIGPQALATVVWLKHHCALPGNKIKDLLHDLCGLKISEGAIAQALQRLSLYLKLESEHILSVLKEATCKHIDETGWNINGAAHWLWSIVNDSWAFVHVDKSRGSRVPKELLGNPFKGVLVSDFFSAYNLMIGRKQKCLVHLRRDIRNAKSEDPPEDFLLPEKKLKRLLSDAERLASRRGKFSPIVFARLLRRLKDRLFDFAIDQYSHPFWQRLSARVLKHHKELLTFLETNTVPSDNNPAERSIKPHYKWFKRSRYFIFNSTNSASSEKKSRRIHRFCLSNSQTGYC